LVARAIYQHSQRAAQPFIAVNCAAIPETLLESELFGHERGSFTGAHARRIGRFEQANRGTIFLDEIGDLSPGTQVKLLRVLQEKCLQRVGGTERIPVDVRVLAATHRDLETAMRERLFREDLFYRLSSVTITLPPLRERVEDIPDSAKYCLQRAAAEIGRPAPPIQPEAISFVQAQAWPGNVRELENVVRRSLLLAQAYPVSLDHVQKAYARAQRPVSMPERTFSSYFAERLNRAQRGELADSRATMIEEMERELFSRAIEMAHGNQAKAARWLGVSRTTMREKLAHFGLHLSGESSPEDA
jgi:transcriptional regulator with GAF, ATPase, and Fis domain